MSARVHLLARAAVPPLLLLLLLLAVAGCRRQAPPPAKGAPTSAVTPPAAPPPPPVPEPTLSTTLLGGERGLDHVGVAVKDLAAATHVYHDLLGFSRPQEGRLDNGIQNVNYYFPDATYLETLTPWDKGRAAWLAEFTEHHAGAAFAVLSAHSLEATRTFLSGRGVTLAAVYPGRIEVKGAKAGEEAQSFTTFFLPNGLLAGDPLYFIAYPRGPRQEYLRKLQIKENRRQLYHENTALGLKAVWIAVSDLDGAVEGYESIGLVRKEAFEDPQMGAKCVAFDAGLGEIVLYAAAAKGSPVRRFLDERGRAGILGVTLLAGSVPAAQRLLAERLKTAVPVYDGRYGRSVRVGPERTMGVWMEFAQYLVPSAK